MVRTQFESRKSYFYVELPDGTILLHSIDENEKFPCQIGRVVIAAFIYASNKPSGELDPECKMFDDGECKVSHEEESKMIDEFKKHYGELDPNNYFWWKTRQMIDILLNDVPFLSGVATNAS